MRAMREVRKSALIARPAARVFGIIADVERYPEFVPGCHAARSQRLDDGDVLATLEVRRGPLSTTFTTRNRLLEPREVSMQLVDGPFRALVGRWSLQPIGEQGCRIDLELRFEFARGFPAALLDPVFEDLAASLVDAFVARSRDAAAAP
jgi:ribosome-associated toxin RatA of RatAB toxin-antitoxin module